jgi:putative restriction endonuclease
MIDEYIKSFARLRTDRNPRVWTPLTKGQAPHKPFLLLSVIDLFAEGIIQENLVQPSFELVDTFNTYWSRIMPLGSKGNPAYPFTYLRSEGFWHLVGNPGYEDKVGLMQFSSMTRLRECCAGARLDDELYGLLNDLSSRETLRAVLVRNYFDSEIQPALLDQGAVNYEAYVYSRKLLDRPAREEHGSYNERGERVRDQGFRRAVVNLYEHRCAICGIRMLTPSGHTIVDASHIKPWSVSFDDHPTNGLCLCKLCHWSFDEGILSVGEKYQVLVSKAVRKDNNLPGYILNFQDRPIFFPTKEEFRPDQENLGWHREKVFAIS